MSPNTAVLLHLADLASPMHTLCGLPIADVAVGGYCEHLDDDPYDPYCTQTIFDDEGRDGAACLQCLAAVSPVIVFVFSGDERDSAKAKYHNRL